MMVMVKTTGAFVLFLLLCAAWLSLSAAARLHPGAEVDNATSASMISAETASNKSQVATIFDGESKKANVETEVVRNKGKIEKPSLSSSSSSLSSSSSQHCSEKRKRRLRRHWSDEIDKGFVAFSADYHGPRHHPPKNN